MFAIRVQKGCWHSLDCICGLVQFERASLVNGFLMFCFRSAFSRSCWKPKTGVVY